MSKNMKFAVIGGDLRFIKVTEFLIKYGHNVKTLGFNVADMTPDAEGLHKCSDIGCTVQDVDCIILPLPYTIDGKNVNAPFSKTPISLDALYESASQCQLMVGGRLDDTAYQKAGYHGFRFIDYFDREELAVLNAIPTCEGAIQIVMEELPITIHNSKCLIVGYGRIGKYLCKTLHGLGANVTVAARKHSDIAWIKAFGYTPVYIDKIADGIDKYDFVINTAPSLILDETHLINLKSDCLIIDLASKPGGVNFDAARQIGIKAIWALSLPGKVAPLTSGAIITDTILNIMSEEVT